VKTTATPIKNRRVGATTDAKAAYALGIKHLQIYIRNIRTYAVINDRYTIIKVWRTGCYSAFDDDDDDDGGGGGGGGDDDDDDDDDVCSSDDDLYQCW